MTLGLESQRVGEVQGDGSFGSDLQVDVPSRSGLMSGGQGGTDYLGQRSGPHCSRTPFIKMTFERHVYSGLKIKNKMCSSGPTIFHPIQEGSRQMGAATSPRLTRWARKPCHLTRLSSGRGGQTRPRCTVTAVSLFFWKQEEHLAKCILSSQWNDVRRDLLSRAAAGASLCQAGSRPARFANSHAARDRLGFVHCWNILKTL